MMAEWGILASLKRPVTQPINIFACTADGILTVSTNETSMRGFSDPTIHSYILYLTTLFRLLFVAQRLTIIYELRTTTSPIKQSNTKDSIDLNLSK